MTRRLTHVILLGAMTVAAACGGDGTSSPTSPMSLSGTWTGSGSDSSTAALGTGAMMGQAGMGTMTWQLTQSDADVIGSVAFQGMPGAMMRGTLSGTMLGENMTFTMTMPAGSMMAAACSAQATGTAHMDPATMTMTGTYAGTNSCAGAFSSGQLTMTRR